MKKLNLTVHFFIVLFSLISCNGEKSKKADLRGFTVREEVAYDTKLAIFSLNRPDVVEYCKDEDNGEPNDFIYRQLVQYITSSTANPIVITDTLGTKTESIEFDRVATVRDPQSPYSNVTDALHQALLSLAQKGKMKVTDKATGKAAEYIMIKEVETKGYGETNIHLPNDSLIFSYLRWIR